MSRFRSRSFPSINIHSGLHQEDRIAKYQQFEDF